MVRKNIMVLALLCAVIYLAGLAGYANAAPAVNPKCDTLSGAAYGMCLSAFAIGCDDPANTNPGCTTIADKYMQVTGDTPVWTLPPCPCGEAQNVIDYLDAARVPITSCSEYQAEMLLMLYGGNGAQAWSYYPNSPTPSFTCNFKGLKIGMKSNDEAQSCINELKSVISQYNLTCNPR